jgi:alpha-1,2-mannosyltransferase
MLHGAFVAPSTAPKETSARRANLIAVATGAVGLALFAVTLSGYGLFDFRVFWDAGHHLLAGERIYPTRAALDLDAHTYFVYPPIVAALFVPFSLIPFAVAGALYTLLAVGATAATIWILGVRDIRCYIAVLFWVPVLQSIGFGTIEPFLGLALALAWVHRRSTVVLSLALGCAVAAKLFLWPLVFWLVATRRWRAALTSVLATAALILVPWALLGFRDLVWYPKALGLLLKHERAMGYETRDVLGAVDLGTAAIVVQIAAVLAVFWLAARQDGDRRSFSAAIVCALVLSPLVWIHYYALLVVPIALVRPRLSWLWVIPILSFWPPGNNPGQPLLTFAIVAILTGVGVASYSLGADADNKPRCPQP